METFEYRLQALKIPALSAHKTATEYAIQEPGLR